MKKYDYISCAASFICKKNIEKSNEINGKAVYNGMSKYFGFNSSLGRARDT